MLYLKSVIVIDIHHKVSLQ